MSQKPMLSGAYRHMATRPVMSETPSCNLHKLGCCEVSDTEGFDRGSGKVAGEAKTLSIGAAPVVVAVWWVALPTGPALTGMASMAAAALVYEWVHYLTHTPYRPRSRCAVEPGWPVRDA